jgi:hypothetical protein
MAKKRVSKHDDLLDAAKQAADALHADTSVPLSETLMSLRDLGGHVDMLIDAVEHSNPAGDDDDYSTE